MDQVTVVRNPTKQFILSGSFLFIAALIALTMFQKTNENSLSAELLCAAIVATCLWGLWRTNRCCYLEVSSSRVKVRTFLRTRIFDPKMISSVAQMEYIQGTRRVCPVITFDDGKTYKLTELFSRKAAFLRSPQNDVVTLAIAAIASVLG